MAFVLRGEIDIDGRKGIVTLRQTQREAQRTSQTFERGTKINSQFVKSLFTINSQAAATNRALLLLGRTGAIGLFGAGLVKGGIALGDTLTNIGKEAETSGKALDKAFQAGLKATSAEGVRSSIESITAEVERLKSKTEGFDFRRSLGKGIQKLTGIDVGLTPEEGLIAAGEKEIEILKKRLEARRKLEETVKAQEAYNESLDITNTKNKELIKLDFARSGPIARARRRLGTEQLQIANLELDQQSQSLDNLKKQKNELLSISGIKKDDEVVSKINLQIRKQELSVIKSQAAVETLQRKEKGGILAGTRPGRASLERAQRRKDREDEQDAKKRENEYLKGRVTEENRKRSKSGLPPLSLEDMRNRVADEAVGRTSAIPSTPTATGTQALPSAAAGATGEGMKAEITPMEGTMTSLLNEFKGLASILKSAPLVTSGAGSN